jgi:hypothetical protein
MRTLYDSTNWSAIPTTAQMVAGYVPPSGFAWPQSAWNRFPNSIHVRITPQVSTTGVGVQVLDVEQGDATPAQAPGWVITQRRLGQIPTVYCSASLWGTVQAAFVSAGVPHPCYWIAAYPGGGPTLPTLNGITAVAHQYADPATSGGDYDLSVVADYWPGVDQGGGTVLDPTNPTDETVIAGAESCLPGIAGQRSAGDLYLLCYNTQQQVAQIATAQAALTSVVADLQKAVAALTPPTALAGQAAVTIQLAPPAANPAAPASTPAGVA